MPNWRQAVVGVVLVVSAATPFGASLSAGTVQGADPYWFREDYLDTGGTNLSATTALVNTAGPGTVQLPYAPSEAAFDPRGTYALVATEGGVAAYVFDGQRVVPVPTWQLTVAATGAAWVHGGDAFAISTASEVLVYGLTQNGESVLAAKAPVAGVIGLAPGPRSLPSSVLAATATGAALFQAQGDMLTSGSGGPSGLTGNEGVAATGDGSVAATWQQENVQLWTWDGSAYRRAGVWDPPVVPASEGPVAGVAFLPQGRGYWVLTRQGQLRAYAFGATGLAALAEWSLSVPVNPYLPMTLAQGWSPASAAVVYPNGWAYEDLATGATLTGDSVRSLTGQDWASYVRRATVESIVLPVGHQLRQVRVEDADCGPGQLPPDCTHEVSTPPGTAVSYQVSTDACRTWTATPLFTNVTVPSGSRLCDQVTLSTTDPTRSPLVDVTNLYEIAQQRNGGSVASVLCTVGSC